MLALMLLGLNDLDITDFGSHSKEEVRCQPPILQILGHDKFISHIQYIIKWYGVSQWEV